MKASIVLTLSLVSLNASATTPFSPECHQRYLHSPNAEVRAAGKFLAEAGDDFDYPSIDAVTTFVRRAQELKAWDKPDYLDVLNFAVVRAVQADTDLFCSGRPWTLPRVQAHLLTVGIPRYFKDHPGEAEEAYWQE